MKRSARNLLIGAGAAVVGAGAVAAGSHRVAKKLVNAAMDRDGGSMMEKSKIKTPDSPEVVALQQTIAAAAKALEKGDSQMVMTTSRDGLILMGHWHTCKNPKRVIIAMHGWHTTWAKDFGMIADFWQDNDCCILYAEQRGQGRSEGDYIGFGLLERYDCLTWVQWVNRKTGASLPIYLAGMSMGATTVLMAAGLKLPENVKGIGADCGFTSPYAIWKHVSEQHLHIPMNGLMEYFAQAICRQKIQLSPHDYSTVDALKNCKVPIMLVHGTEDSFVPVNMSYENYAVCTAPKRLMIVPGAEHGMSYLVEKERYEQEVLDFWQMCECT